MLQHLVLECDAGSFTAGTAIEFVLTRTLSEEVLTQSVPSGSKPCSRIAIGTAHQVQSCGRGSYPLEAGAISLLLLAVAIGLRNRVSLQVATLQKGGASQKDLQGTLSQLRERPSQVMQSRVTGKCISGRPLGSPLWGRISA